MSGHQRLGDRQRTNGILTCNKCLVLALCNCPMHTQHPIHLASVQRTQHPTHCASSQCMQDPIHCTSVQLTQHTILRSFLQSTQHLIRAPRFYPTPDLASSVRPLHATPNSGIVFLCIPCNTWFMVLLLNLSNNLLYRVGGFTFKAVIIFLCIYSPI